MDLILREKQLLLEILMQLKWDTNQAEVALEVKQISIKIQESLRQTEEPNKRQKPEKK